MTMDSPEMVSMPLKMHDSETHTNTRQCTAVFVTQRLLLFWAFAAAPAKRPRKLPRELGQTDPPLAEA